MADFLNRLMQRTSGQLPVIKPMVMPGYGTLPHINESVTEFEETVTFTEDTNSQASHRQTPAKSPPVTGQPRIGEKREPGKTGERSEVEIMSDASRHSMPPEGQSSIRNTLENGIAVPPVREITTDKTGEMITENVNRNDKVITGTQNDRVIPVQSRPDSGPEKEKVNRQRVNLAGIPVTPSINEHIADDSPQRSSTAGIPDLEKTALRQADIVAVREVTPVMSSDIKSPERDLPRESERAEPAAAFRQVNLIRRYETALNSRQNEIITGRADARSIQRETSPSMNIKVTIGRVEVKAVPPPERQIQRKPSVPRSPAVSLDAYLQGRDEEGR
jgi:hypothetical protein